MLLLCVHLAATLNIFTGINYWRIGCDLIEYHSVSFWHVHTVITNMFAANRNTILRDSMNFIVAVALCLHFHFDLCVDTTTNQIQSTSPTKIQTFRIADESSTLSIVNLSAEWDSMQILTARTHTHTHPNQYFISFFNWSIAWSFDRKFVSNEKKRH